MQCRVHCFVVVVVVVFGGSTYTKYASERLSVIIALNISLRSGNARYIFVRCI